MKYKVNRKAKVMTEIETGRTTKVSGKKIKKYIKQGIFDIEGNSLDDRKAYFIFQSVRESNAQKSKAAYKAIKAEREYQVWAIENN